jgi:hypothetical protein
MGNCPRSHLHRLHCHLHRYCCLPWWGGSSSPPGLRALSVAMWFISLSHGVIYIWSWALYLVELVDVTLHLLCYWWCGVDIVDRPVGNPKRRCDEHSSKSSLSYETKVNRTSRKKKLQKLMLASFVTLRKRAPDKLLVGVSSPSSNAKPAHNTTKNFAPILRWGCQSHRFAVNKGLSISSGNRIIVCKK